jgi:putative nucleotidyltransferase with HDIG domain
VVDRGDLRARVERLTDLAAAPDVVDRVRHVASREHHSAGELADAVNSDPALTTRVLRVVNSGFFSFPQPITTITHALVLLGTDVVKALVVTAPVFELFGKAHALWEHSVATARVASVLAAQLGHADPEEVGIAGLLHDVGKVVLADEAPAATRTIRSLVREQGLLVSEAEQQVLGFTHADVGAWLLQRWNLHPRLTDPVAHHHRFDERRAHADRTAIVHVADILARARGVGDPGDAGLPALDATAWRVARLEMTHVRAAFDDLDRLAGELSAANQAGALRTRAVS